MSEISVKLDALLAGLASKGFESADNLNPGLSDEVLDAYASRFGAPLPAPVRDLYRWHNGCADHEAEFRKLLFFRDQPFLSLDDALLASEQIKMVIGIYESSGLPTPFAANALIPIAGFEGSIYAVATHPIEALGEYQNPIISLDEGLSVYFHSMETMLDTCIEWVGDAAFSIDSLQPADEVVAWEKYNPGVFDIRI